MEKQIQIRDRRIRDKSETELVRAKIPSMSVFREIIHQANLSPIGLLARF